MAIVWILLWMWAFIIVVKDYKTESTLWLSGLLFFNGLGAFSVVSEKTIMNYLIVQYGISQVTISFISIY